MGNSVPRTPKNRRAEFDAASFIIGGEIRNRTNTKLQIRYDTIRSINVRSKCDQLNLAHGPETKKK